MPLEDRKGEEIRFSAGIYRGLLGWMDTDNAETPCFYYVIVSKADGALKATKVKKESVNRRFQRPTCRIEAAFQQYPDVDESLDKLVKKLAQCAINGSDQMLIVFKRKLDQAYGRQIALGPKALWKVVEYEEEVVVEVEDDTL
jgi:hypothetical protein